MLIHPTEGEAQRVYVEGNRVEQCTIDRSAHGDTSRAPGVGSRAW